MSGSPVYIDDRLIGALSYRMGSLPTEPVAGVTPIDDMLSANPAGAAGGLSPAGASAIATPLLAGSLVDSAREWAAPRFERLGFQWVAGGASTAGKTAAGPLRPGSPVGVELMRGALSLAATGTVTWVEGDLVYAFGHPFLGDGNVALPMVSAEIVHTLGDQVGSSKFARVGGEIGAVFEDRLSGIVGRRGAVAPMVPLSLRLTGGRYGDQKLEFEIVGTRQLAPTLSGLAVINAILRNVDRERRMTVRVDGTIELNGAPSVPLEMSFSGEGATDPAVAVAGRLQQIAAALWNNPHEAADVRSIELEVQLQAGVRAYRLESLHYDRGPVRAGEQFEIHCRIRREREAPRVERLRLTIPPGIPGGTELRVFVGPPSQLEVGEGRPLQRRLVSATDLNGVIGVLAELKADHRLTVLLVEPSPGSVSRGQAYPALPPTAARLLGSDRGQGNGALAYARLAHAERALDGPIQGGLAVRLKVEAGPPRPGKENAR